MARRPLAARPHEERRARSVASAASKRALVPLGHRQVVEIQRARLVAAAVHVVNERGAEGVSVAHVVERSGVSRRTFYELFADREDCFLAAFEQALAYACERVLPAYRSQTEWVERMRAALGALLRFLDREPALARLLIVESPAGGARALARRRETIAQITRAVDAGREGGANADPQGSLTAEGVVGGALAVVHSRLAEGSAQPLIDLLNPLMSMIALPYLGATAARRELDRPPPEPAASERADGALVSDPFKEAGIRLTYRTARALTAIAERPGASNRTIGETAGVTDQGQISKLLARLERLGLVMNAGIHPGKGAPNAWRLTGRGEQAVAGLRAHAEDSQ